MATSPWGAMLLLLGAALGALVITSQEVTAQALPPTLQFQFTIRDFMPAACMKDQATLNSYWPPGPPSPSPSPSSPGSLTLRTDNAANCRIGLDIRDGYYSGHPDFEVEFNNRVPLGTSGVGFNLTTQALGGSPAKNAEGHTLGAGDALTRIVERELEQDETGIPKPRYCTNPTMVLVYNKRVSTPVTLTLSGGVYSVSSAAFFPLANFPACVATNSRLDCSNGGKRFPSVSYPGSNPSQNEVNDQGPFLFTSETHSWFTYRGGEILEFSGDDDVWVFINERLAVDIGGVHGKVTARIRLEMDAVEKTLGLVRGNVYAFDFYHAERHTVESNFILSTTLVPDCNVVMSGTTFYGWNTPTLLRDWKILGGPNWGVVDAGRIKLTSSGVLGSVASAYLRQQVNVGTGFIAKFKFSASQNRGEGFVFAIQRDTITDLNGGSGGNLGFKHTNASVGIAFDFCADRNTSATPACLVKQARIHYLPTLSSTLTNDAMSNEVSLSRKFRTKLIHPNELNDEVLHEVTIKYYGSTPPWLEVYIDEDLFLQSRNMNLDAVLGGRNAYMGFTASTGATLTQTSDIYIQNFTVVAVSIVDNLTQTVDWPAPGAPLKNATANGRDAASFFVKNFDYCGNPIEFGGFASRAKGRLTPVPPTASTRRLLAINETTNGTLGVPPEPIDAVVVDPGTGTYELRFTSRGTNVGEYTVEVWYGEGCFVGGNSSGALVEPRNLSTCFYRGSDEPVVVFYPVPPVPVVPDDDAPQGLPPAALTGIGVAAGIVSAVGAVLIIVGIRVRNRWRRDKDFIEAGRLAAAERGVGYMGDNELDQLQNRLQHTLVELQRERAKQAVPEDQQATIDALNRQRGELQEQVRMLKMRAMGQDPRMGMGTETFLARARKSFSAKRVSRGLSAAGDQLAVAENPQFGYGRDSRGFSTDSQGVVGRASGRLSRIVRNPFSRATPLPSKITEEDV